VETATESGTPEATRDTRPMKPDAAEEIVDVFSDPVRSCAKFYGYYYLSEIEQDPFASQIFDDVADKMSDAFYNYAVFATLRELANVKSHGVIQRDRLQAAANQEGVNLARKDKIGEELSISSAMIHIRSIPQKR